MQQAKEFISFHTQEAGYAAISLLANIGVVFSDVFILSAGINLLTKPSVFLNPEVLVACAFAGITSTYSGRISSWARDQNNKLWIERLEKAEISGKQT